MSQVSSVSTDLSAAFSDVASFDVRPATRIASTSRSTTALSTRALNASAASWFVVAALGQLMFVVYVIGFFGRAALRGDLAAWNKVLPHGYVAGDPMGNLVVMLHLAFASGVILSGLVQLVPKVRQIAPRFHRWNGRFYLVSALVMSVGGLIMVWTRGAMGSLSQDISINLNAFVIIGCAVMAYRYARARRIDVHRRWALRLFIAVSGVWFFRIGLMFWIVVNGGPVGFDPDTFQGPTITALGFGQFVVPLAVLELYLRARDGRSSRARVAMAGVLGALTLTTAAGVVAATLIMWVPRL